MSKKSIQTRKKPRQKPDLPPVLFWEFRYETINWQAAYLSVIERVLDRGNAAELEELIRFYGRDKVLIVLKYESIYLMDHSIERACSYFNVKKEELFCYHRKRMPGRGKWL